METESGPAEPEQFPSLPGCVFPLYHVLADIGEMRGGRVLRGTCRHPRTTAGITIQRERARRTLIANLGFDEQTVTVRGIPARRALVRLLDETTVEHACRTPDQYRGDPGAAFPVKKGELELKLLPYAVARIDWED